MDLCPSCGIREVDTPSGFCAPCVVDRAASNYSEADRARAAARTRIWETSSSTTRTDAALATLRQQRRRQIAAVRPTKPMSDPDPWEIAIEAIGRTRRIAQSFAAGRSELEEIAEALRRLAWGPDEGQVWLPKVRPRHRRQIPGQLHLFGEALEVAA